MTSDVAEEYNEEINDIYEKQNNLSKIIRKHTHIMEAEVTNVHQDINRKINQIYYNLLHYYHVNSQNKTIIIRII